MNQYLSSKHNIVKTGNKISCETCSISKLCIPSALSDSEVNRLDSIISRGTVYHKGNFLNQAGDNFKHLYAVSSGSFKSYSLCEDGAITITGFYFPGDLIGLDAIHVGTHQNFVKALETSAVCALPFDMLEGLSGEIPKLRNQIMKIMSKEINEDQELHRLLSRKNAAERMASFMLGLAIETVSRLLGQFQKNGIINVSDKCIEITDMAALSEMAGAKCGGSYDVGN